MKKSARRRRASLVSEESNIFNEAESNNLCSFLEKNCGKKVNAWSGGYGWDAKFLRRTCFKLLGTLFQNEVLANMWLNKKVA